LFIVILNLPIELLIDMILVLMHHLR